MLVLIGRAAASLAKRAGLYISLTFVVIAIQVAVHYFWRTAAALPASELVVISLGSAVVYAATQADVDGTQTQAFWGRALERAWAVIVVTFVQQLFQGFARSFIIFGGDILDRAFGVIVLIMALTLWFADIDAVVSQDDRWWLLVPMAISNSIRAAWSGSTMLRIIILFLASFLLTELAESVEVISWMKGLHVPDPAFWASTVVDALLLAPFGILTTFVYFDAIGYESKRPCGE